MSNNSKAMKAKLGEIRRLHEELIGMLIDNPCLDDNSKKEMYQLAIYYFETKRKQTRLEGNGFYNGANTIRLSLLIDCYNDAQGEAKLEYARLIARNVLDTSKYWLKLIPYETREDAFQIIIEYLEQQMSS